jgi:hypothetical protein
VRQKRDPLPPLVATTVDDGRGAKQAAGRGFYIAPWKRPRHRAPAAGPAGHPPVSKATSSLKLPNIPEYRTLIVPSVEFIV